MAWVIDAGRTRRHLCVVNLDGDRPTAAFGIPRRPLTDPPPRWLPIFTTAEGDGGVSRPLRSNGHQWIVEPLESGECRVYRSDADS